MEQTAFSTKGSEQSALSGRRYPYHDVLISWQRRRHMAGSMSPDRDNGLYSLGFILAYQGALKWTLVVPLEAAQVLRSGCSSMELMRT